MTSQGSGDFSMGFTNQDRVIGPDNSRIGEVAYTHAFADIPMFARWADAATDSIDTFG
jgi:hypothetical protein